jgi:hypothetical protein
VFPQLPNWPQNVPPSDDFLQEADALHEGPDASAGMKEESARMDPCYKLSILQYLLAILHPRHSGKPIVSSFETFSAI